MFHCDLYKLYDVDQILLGTQVHRHIQLNYQLLDKYDQLDSEFLCMDRLVGDENGISKCHNYDFKIVLQINPLSDTASPCCFLYFDASSLAFWFSRFKSSIWKLRLIWVRGFIVHFVGLSGDLDILMLYLCWRAKVWVKNGRIVWLNFSLDMPLLHSYGSLSMIKKQGFLSSGLKSPILWLQTRVSNEK